MDWRRLTALATVLVGLVAIVLAAGTYTNRSGPAFGGVPNSGAEGMSSPPGLPGWVIENALVVLLVGSVLFVTVAALVIVWLRGVEGLKRIASVAAQYAVAGLAVALLFAGVRFGYEWLSGGLIDPPDPGGGGGSGTPGPNVGPEMGTGGEAVPGIYLFLVVFALLGVFMYFAFRRRGRGGAPAAGADAEAPAAADDAERTAGPEAIDLDDVPQSNAVYRAWHDLATRAIDATDRTVTASEVARAGIRAGLDREAVWTLTSLFEEVRYGDRPVTDDRERRAKAALQAIEEGEA